MVRDTSAEQLSGSRQLLAILSDVSLRLLTSDPAIFANEINRALGKIGLSYNLDSIATTFFDHRHHISVRRHGWGEPIDSVPSHISMREYKWAYARYRSGRCIRVPDIDNMSAEIPGPEREFLRALGLKSFFSAPLMVSNKLWGTCGFGTTFRREEWSNETVSDLRILAGLLAAADARMQAAESIMHSERDLAQSQRVACMGSWFFDQASKKIEYSAALSEMLGCKPGEETLNTLLSLIHPEDREQVIDSARKANESESELHIEFRILKPDGSVCHVECRNEFERDADGNNLRGLGTLQDITDRVVREQRLQHALAAIIKLKDQLETENLQLRKDVKSAHQFEKIIGESLELRRCLDAVEKVAGTDIPVLIIGETGTGKECIAQVIHDFSDRQAQTMVKVNCAALPANLIESELFGHEKGAFTGAQARRAGRFERADGGTLFLDEIGDLPLELQGKLLRVLQDGEFERLGGNVTLKVNTRIIAATHRDLQRRVDEGNFRADLFYRINSFPVDIPPLRKRGGDIALLSQHFVEKHAARLGRKIESISGRMLRQFEGYAWPGNVRELEGVIQRALITNSGTVLDLAGPLGFDIQALIPATTDSDGDNLNNVERRHILQVLEKSGWVIAGDNGAANALGMPPSTLRSRMKRLEIRRHDSI